MKSVALYLSRQMPITPVSRWIGPTGWMRACRGTPHGEAIPGDLVPAPYYHRKSWAELEVHVDGITLYFATPLELDEVTRVLSQNPLPSTRTLTRDRAAGPNSHWLSRLPKKSKTQKWRQKFLRYIAQHPKVAAFRAFYDRSQEPAHV